MATGAKAFSRSTQLKPLGVRHFKTTLLEVTDDWKIRVVSNLLDLFVDHKTKNSEHGGTAVVQFDGTLLELGLFIKVIPVDGKENELDAENTATSNNKPKPTIQSQCIRFGSHQRIRCRFPGHPS